jgi:hypothetical protein
MVSACRICAIDDLVFDVTYWVARARGRAAWPARTMGELDAVPQRKAAIITATWQEEAVIGRMVHHVERHGDHMTQLPVFSLAGPWWRFIAGTYWTNARSHTRRTCSCGNG